MTRITEEQRAVLASHERILLGVFYRLPKFDDPGGIVHKTVSILASTLADARLALKKSEARIAELEAAPNPERMFPIMDGRSIPWSLITPFERQAMANHGGQSLERLAERGGLSKAEAYAVVAGSSIRDVVRQLEVTKAAAHWDEWLEARLGPLARIAELEVALAREREALAAIRNYATGHTEVDDGEDAEDALDYIRDIVDAARAVADAARKEGDA